MRVLCDAVAFGFGPVGKLLAIRSYLPATWEFTLLASGTTYELASASRFAQVVNCDTEDLHDLAANKRLFEDHDVFINVMNPVSAEFALQYGIPVVQIDSLFWMWDHLPDCCLDSSAYYIQNFPGVDQNLSRFSPHVPVRIGPIVDMRYMTSRDNRGDRQLVIHLGGMTSKMAGGQEEYAYRIAHLLNDVLASHSFDRVLLAGNEQVWNRLAHTWLIPQLEVRTLGHAEFLAELDRSELALLSPGLTATYESFAYGVPCIFLPPQNFSQFHIGRILRQHGAAPLGVHWDDLYTDIDCELGIPEEEGVRKVLEIVSDFGGNVTKQAQAATMLRQALDSPDLNQLVANQGHFLDLMGRDGAHAVATDLQNRFAR